MPACQWMNIQETGSYGFPGDGNHVGGKGEGIEEHFHNLAIPLICGGPFQDPQWTRKP